jgi:hypothetical protein
MIIKYILYYINIYVLRRNTHHTKREWNDGIDVVIVYTWEKKKKKEKSGRLFFPFFHIFLRLLYAH